MSPASRTPDNCPHPQMRAKDDAWHCPLCDLEIPRYRSRHDAIAAMRARLRSPKHEPAEPTAPEGAA